MPYQPWGSVLSYVPHTGETCTSKNCFTFSALRLSLLFSLWGGPQSLFIYYLFFFLKPNYHAFSLHFSNFSFLYIKKSSLKNLTTFFSFRNTFDTKCHWLTIIALLRIWNYKYNGNILRSGMMNSCWDTFHLF